MNRRIICGAPDYVLTKVKNNISVGYMELYCDNIIYYNKMIIVLTETEKDRLMKEIDKISDFKIRY